MELQKVQRTTLTMKEAAEYLGISYWLINQLVRRRQIPCSKVGGKFLFRVQMLDEYLKRDSEREFFGLSPKAKQEPNSALQGIKNTLEPNKPNLASQGIKTPQEVDISFSNLS